jgi:serine/threonine protein kinase
LGDTISPKADIFLLGITFYEMLTGTRPFKEEAGETVFQRIREAKFIPPREMQMAIPKVLDKMICKCLSKKPENRFRNVKDLIEELERFLGKKSLHTEDLILKYLDEEALVTPAVPYTDITEDKSFSKEFPRWESLLAIFVATAIAFFVGLWLGSNRGNSPHRPTGYEAPKGIR